MQRLVLISLAGAITLALAGNALAGNSPNTARTLTGGIGLSSSHSRVPTGLPYNTSRAVKRSSKANSVLEGVNLNRYRGGISNRPLLPGGNPGTASGSSRPTSIPATLPSQAGGHPPATIGGRPSDSGGGYIPSTTPPTGIPATLPSQTGTHPPAMIGGKPTDIDVGSRPSGTPPTAIPATLPSQTAGHPPGSIGRP